MDLESCQVFDQILSYASCFFSIFEPGRRLSPAEARAQVTAKGPLAAQRFEWLERKFGVV